MPKKKTKIELFEELAGIDENGCSRWVSVDEFVGKYQGLQLLNGAGWSRDDGTFGKIFDFSVIYIKTAAMFSSPPLRLNCKSVLHLQSLLIYYECYSFYQPIPFDFPSLAARSLPHDSPSALPVEETYLPPVR